MFQGCDKERLIIVRQLNSLILKKKNRREIFIYFILKHVELQY